MYNSSPKTEKNVLKKALHTLNVLFIANTLFNLTQLNSEEIYSSQKLSLRGMTKNRVIIKWHMYMLSEANV